MASPLANGIRTLSREGAALVAPACFAAILVLVCRTPEASVAQEVRRGAPRESTALCDARHVDRGETRRVDLDLVVRRYAELKGKLESSLGRTDSDLPKSLDVAYDLGLPTCRGRKERKHGIPDLAARLLRGRKLLFVSVGDPDRVRLPSAIKDDPKAEILVVRCTRLRDLGELAKTFKRPVGLAARELAEALGVRCADTWIELAESGDVVVLHEGD